MQYVRAGTAQLNGSISFIAHQAAAVVIEQLSSSLFCAFPPVVLFFPPLCAEDDVIPLLGVSRPCFSAVIHLRLSFNSD